METLHGGIYPLVALALCWYEARHGCRPSRHHRRIDAFQRRCRTQETGASMWFLFSLGHGVVVCIVAVGTSFLFQQGAVPAWMDEVGAWYRHSSCSRWVRSTLCSVHDSAHENVQMVGLKGRWLVNSGTRAILC